MNKKEERDQFWINVGPESGYLGTIAEETACKNDGISPDGKRLGWKNACDSGNDCDCNNNGKRNTNCDCENNCDCSENTCDCENNYDSNNVNGCDCNNSCDSENTCDCNSNDSSQNTCDCNSKAPKANRKSATNDYNCPPCSYETPDRNNGDYGDGVVEHRDADDIATDFPYGDPCDDAIDISKVPLCGVLPLPGMVPSEDMGCMPLPDIGPERQNTQE